MNLRASVTVMLLERNVTVILLEHKIQCCCNIARMIYRYCMMG